ncbi:MAG: ribosome biogenesis GTP-binding protein YsxC, partial [Clostridia bacterium]|nr:ribosome biogenesis GTP-binding protein YsxC [Clostridia bacterium]
MNFHIVEFEAAYGKSKQIPPSDMPEIVFSGKSNVGKSSLINKILYRKSIARVSATPGKTATINFFKLTDVRFADLPGYGYAKVSKSEKDRWAELVEGYFAQDRNISLIVQ